MGDSQVAAGSQVDFGVVIPTRRRVGSLARLLDRLAELAGEAAQAWCVRVVENGEEAGAAQVLDSRRGAYPWPLDGLLEPRLGLSHARNRGIEGLGAEVFVFLDDDVTPRRGWYASLERAFADPGLAAAGGPVLPVYPPGTPEDYRRAVECEGCGSTGYYHHGEEECDVVPKGPVGAPRGGNMAVRRAALAELGGFDPRLGWGRELVPGEETHLVSRLLAAGRAVRYLPGAAVDHHLQPEKVGWEYLRRWHLGYGRASVRMRPRPNAPMAALKVAEQCLVWACYRTRWALERGPASLRPRRKCWQAEGRLAELLGKP